MVQCRSARFVNNNYRKTASPSDKIETLRWESLAEKGKKSKFMDKIGNNLKGIPTLFKPVNPYGRRRNTIFHISYCNAGTFTFSFIPSAAIDWNSLTEHIGNQNSLDSLKRAFDSLK